MTKTENINKLVDILLLGTYRGQDRTDENVSEAYSLVLKVLTNDYNREQLKRLTDVIVEKVRPLLFSLDKESEHISPETLILSKHYVELVVLQFRENLKRIATHLLTYLIEDDKEQKSLEAAIGSLIEFMQRSTDNLNGVVKQNKMTTGNQL